MSRRSFVRPRTWTPEEIERDRLEAIERFKNERLGEEPRVYADAFDRVEPLVRELLASTRELRSLNARALRSNRDRADASRFLCGPPISEDDLETLVGLKSVRTPLTEEAAEELVRVLRAALDPRRFPWLGSNRAPTKAETETAVLWTAGLWAVERVRTHRRTSRSKLQETAVADSLRRAGYVEVERSRGPREIRVVDDLPRGTFARETRLAGAKCDVPVGLKDGRLMAVECKVSNSAVNSVKRLVRETGGKADRWRTEFGNQVVPAAVLSGVFQRVNLQDAQDRHHVALFWEHRLSDLEEFARAASSGA